MCQDLGLGSGKREDVPKFLVEEWVGGFRWDRLDDAVKILCLFCCLKTIFLLKYSCLVKGCGEPKRALVISQRTYIKDRVTTRTCSFY